MPLTGPTLAAAIATGMSFLTTSSIMLSWGNAIADEINNSATSPYPVSGPITGLSGSRISSAFSSASGKPVTSEVSAFANQIAAHIMSFGIQSGGLVTGLNGSALADAIAGAAGYSGTSSELSAFCTSLVANVMSDTIMTH